jgi:hypothetical protein
MKPELNLTYDEKVKIGEWKQSLPQRKREFIYTFVENGKYSEDGYKLYSYIIKSDDKFSLIVSENVKL